MRVEGYQSHHIIGSEDSGRQHTRNEQCARHQRPKLGVLRFRRRRKSCRQGNNGVAGSDLVGPGEWGQLVREEGRHAIYERDFGSGNRVVTFVTWAD